MKKVKQQIKKKIKKEETSLEKEYIENSNFLILKGDIQRLTSSSDSENQLYMAGYVAGLERALRFIREYNSSKRK